MLGITAWHVLETSHSSHAARFVSVLSASHTVSLATGSYKDAPYRSQMLRCDFEQADTESLERLVEDFLTVPGAEVCFAKRTTPNGVIEFSVSKPDMTTWLQTVDVLAPEHSPIESTQRGQLVELSQPRTATI